MCHALSQEGYQGPFRPSGRNRALPLRRPRVSERGVWVTLMDSFLCAIGLWMLEVVPRVESTILSLGRVRLLALLVPMAKFWVSETQQSHKLINKLINFKINKIDNQGTLGVSSREPSTVSHFRTPLRGLQETRVATREESGVLGFPSRQLCRDPAVGVRNAEEA